MNWVGIVAICVTVSLTIGGALLGQILGLNRKIGELQTDHQRLLNNVAERYVRSPDFAEFKQTMERQFTAVRAEISELSRSVSSMTGLLHELKGAVSANNPPRG